MNANEMNANEAVAELKRRIHEYDHAVDVHNKLKQQQYLDVRPPNLSEDIWTAWGFE